MRSAIRVSALLLVLGGSLGLVTAQHRAIGDETSGLGTTGVSMTISGVSARGSGRDSEWLIG